MINREFLINCVKRLTALVQSVRIHGTFIRRTLNKVQGFHNCALPITMLSCHRDNHADSLSSGSNLHIDQIDQDHDLWCGIAHMKRREFLAYTLAGAGRLLLPTTAGRGRAAAPPFTVHLSFDDGPTTQREGTGPTIDVLDILKAYRVQATFFVHGIAINDWEGPLLARLITDGHAIGNHLWQQGQNTVRDDASLIRMATQFLRAEVRIRALLQEASPAAYARYLRQPKLYRRPGGDPTLSPFLDLANIARLKASYPGRWYQEHLGWLEGVYDYSGWHVVIGDSIPRLDIRATTPEQGLRFLLNGAYGYFGVDSYLCAGSPPHRSVEASQGLVVLMHDASPVARKALPAAITALRERGAQFAPLPRPGDQPNQLTVSIAIPPTPDAAGVRCTPAVSSTPP
jgi:peptidoglycan/xylan/chitin deacetylase (PgdA/CDA1 family)